MKNLNKASTSFRHAGMDDEAYDAYVQRMRIEEYPMLKGALPLHCRLAHQLTINTDTTYLDHAGTTLYAKSLIERFSADMISSLHGNPHSASSSSQNTAAKIDDIRLRLLQLFKADPDDFDVVFVANATAGIKLVADAFRDSQDGFWYGYHRDSHTSLVGVRELAAEHHCFASDEELEKWVESIPSGTYDHARVRLCAFPAQSNMNGRRLPLSWSGRIRNAAAQDMYTLLDAASLVSTSPLDLSNASLAPDFTVMSLYKIFGFPDLGALVVRKAAGHVLRRRKYFGGGTVDMVVSLTEQWHAKKSDSLHDLLEDGTLPIHSIMAIEPALDVHRELFGTLDRVSRHTARLAKDLYDGLSSLRHGNNTAVCEMYKDSKSTYGDLKSQGPIIAFNIRNGEGAWISNPEIEKLAAVKNIQLRTGGL